MYEGVGDGMNTPGRIYVNMNRSPLTSWKRRTRDEVCFVRRFSEFRSIRRHLVKCMQAAVLIGARTCDLEALIRYVDKRMGG